MNAPRGLLDQAATKVESPCPICGSVDFRQLYPDTIGDRPVSFTYDLGKNRNLTYRLVTCKRCSHSYATPRPANMWTGYTGDTEDAIYLSNSEQRVATGYELLKKLRKFKRSGRLLDVGCATGDFLSIAKDYFEVEGLEISPWSARIARNRGFCVHHKSLGEMDNPDAYDVVTLWGVIEHFEYPQKEVESISRILKKSGLVCLWTGDGNSLMARLLGKKWWWYQAQHIQVFSKRSICELFRNSGFTDVYMGTHPYVVTARSLSNTLALYPFISKITSGLLSSRFLKGLRFTLGLNGEMLAIFEKN